jgi:hypothetical protein
MAARVMLGVFEAGFGPAIPLYFCERDHCCYVNDRIHFTHSLLLHEGRDGSKSQCDIFIFISSPKFI